MLIDKASVSIVLDKRRQKNDKTYPVKLRVIFKGSPRYYSTGYDMTVEDFDKTMSKRPRGEAKEIRQILEAKKTHAQRIADMLPAFTFADFKQKLSGKARKKKTDFYDIFRQYIKEIKSAGQIGTAVSYGNALSSFQKFTPNKISILRLTPQYFERYETWMKSRDCSEATIGMYVRAARAAINYAIEQGYMPQDRYPFAKGGYKPPVGENIKKALTLDQVRQIATYQAENKQEQIYRDFWLLSYLCNGSNMVDILRLKKENFRENVIVISRQKTKRTNRGSKKAIVITISKQIREIVERHGNLNYEGYIFPYLDIRYSEGEMLRKSKLFIKQVNKYMNRIAGNIGIDAHITTYTARHTYATVMKRAGVPIAFISDSLGHSDIRVTERYLAGFEDDYRAKVSEALTDW